ncbi:MAG: ROK family transcriptional regulator [Eubacteriales bacterium]|nr:ROK family transcriptional regulator [Eubacteriales bacterium]
MMDTKIPAQTSVKSAHLITILELIHRQPGITKPELCNQTGLMPSTVHGAVAQLLADKIIVRQGTAASSGGRRASQYRLAANIGCVGSISIRLNHLEVGIFDLFLQPLARAELPLAMSETGPESYTEQAVRLLENCMAQTSFPREKLLGVGVTLPGPVDFRTGVVQQLCGAPRWQQFPMAQRLRQSLNCPIVVDKDVYAVLDLLAQTGEIQNTRCSAYLSICEGIGSALMINGQVFRGSHSLGGEIGHLTVREDGIPCPCGNTGCLELYCSDIGIVQQYNAQTNSKQTSVAQVLALAQGGDNTASRVISQAINYLVDATSTIIMTYDPQELLIFCTWLRDQRALYFWILDTLYAKSIFTQKHAVQIRLMEENPLNLNAAAALAVRQALQEALVNPS